MLISLYISNRARRMTLDTFPFKVENTDNKHITLAQRLG